MNSDFIRCSCCEYKTSNVSLDRIVSSDQVLLENFIRWCIIGLQKTLITYQYHWPMYCLCWSNFEEFNHIKYHWTVRKSDQMMYQRCWKTLPDTATDADLDPPHTPFSLYQPFISNPPPLHFGSTTLQFISTTSLQLYSYIKSSFFKINRLHF